MTKRLQLGLLLLLLMSGAAAQSTGGVAVEVRDLRVAQVGDEVQVEVTLSAAVTPSLTTATGPSRLILDLPNTVSSARQQTISVRRNGVRSVRMGLNSADPPLTRVVVDLDQFQPYGLTSDGNKIVLTVRAAASASRSTSRGGAPPAAAGGVLTGVFRRRQPAPPPVSSTTPSPVLPPPPAQAPIPFPPDQDSAGVTAASASGASTPAPSAAHPNRASLQEGTVFPSLGSPGSGRVPGPVSATANQSQAAPGTGTSLQVSRTGARKDIAIPSVAPDSNTQAATEEKHARDPKAGIATSQSTPATATPTAAQKASPPVQVSVEVAAGEAAGETATEPGGPARTPRPANPGFRTAFKVKYVAEGAAYLDGGRSSGLAEGMKLQVKDVDAASPEAALQGDNNNPAVAELQVISVAETSAVTEIHTPKRDVKPGDLAYLSPEDVQALVEQHALSATRNYPAVVTFTEGDPLDEEAREEAPRPPLPEVNRARGRIGLDYMGIVSHGSSGMTSTSLGLVLRTDITRINGTYWNLSGYWRGRLTSRSSTGQPTLQDLLNRTYHLGLTYDNPKSAWVAGFGRLYLPWASSLDTIDGGYFGRRVSQGATAGLFAGSKPDPTSWDYSLDRRIAGAFINFEGGGFDSLRYTSTSGLGVSTLKWQMDRPFVFFENALFYKRYLSIYHSLQADSPRGNPAVPAPGPGIGRSFLTVRLQPHPRLELDFNHNYFRDVPTFDSTLVGTGLLDKYLFQGVSVGARVEVVKQVFLYTNLGRSSRTGDARSSLNQMYGVTFARLPWTGIRADLHYSRFNSSFGDGSYKALSLSRNFGENLRLELLAGTQAFTSPLSSNNGARFLNTNFETSLGAHYFLQGGWTLNRGPLQNYDQWFSTLGYRFDSKAKHQ